jgi:hypothetical protein
VSWVRRAARSFRGHYGAGPLHLIGFLASLVVVGLAVSGWFEKPLPSIERVLVWFAGAIIAHDLVLLPLYSLVDRLGLRLSRSGRTGAPGWVYVRVPLLLSGLLGLVFAPEILRLGNGTFEVASGQSQDVYLLRYILICAALFACSALVFFTRAAARRRTRASPARSPRRRGSRAP